MKKLHVEQDGKWIPVWGYNGNFNELLLCVDPRRALPRSSWEVNKQHAKDDLNFFSNKFGDKVFKLIEIRC